MAKTTTKVKTAKAKAPPVEEAPEMTAEVATVAPPQPPPKLTPGQQFEAHLRLMRPAIQASLPEGVPWSAFERAAVLAVQRNLDLLTKYDLADVLLAIQDAASDGLLPDGYEGAIIPRWDERKGKTIPRFEPMYQGLLKLARNTGLVTKIAANIVYEGEPFRITLGDVDSIEHERVLECVDPSLTKMRGAYAIAWLTNGQTVSRHMTAQRLNVIRAMSASKRGPWSGVFVDEMISKTMLRFLTKWLALDGQNREHARLLSALKRDDLDLDAIEAQAAEAAKPDALAKIEATETKGKKAAAKADAKPAGDEGGPSKAATAAGAKAADEFAADYIAGLAQMTRRQIELQDLNKAVAARMFRLGEAYPEVYARITEARNKRLAEIANAAEKG